MPRKPTPTVPQKAAAAAARSSARKPTPKELRIEYVPLTELVKWPGNPKRHAHEVLTDSMDEFGFTNPILLDEETGRVVGGHGRIESLEMRRARGGTPPDRVRVEGAEWLIPVIRGLRFKDEKQASRYLVVDNQATILGGFDSRALADLMATWQTEDFKGIGFDEGDLAKFVATTRMDPPLEFPPVTENLPVDYCCPKCRHRWSGSPDPLGALAPAEPEGEGRRAS